MDPEEQKLVLQKTQSEELSQKTLKLFFKGLECENVPQMYKYYNIRYFNGELIKGKKETTQIKLFFSIDYYLSLYTIENDFPSNFLISLPLEQIDIEETEVATLMIKFLQKGIFWNSRRSFQIKVSPFELGEILNVKSTFDNLFFESTSTSKIIHRKINVAPEEKSEELEKSEEEQSNLKLLLSNPDSLKKENK